MCWATEMTQVSHAPWSGVFFTFLSNLLSQDQGQTFYQSESKLSEIWCILFLCFGALLEWLLNLSFYTLNHMNTDFENALICKIYFWPTLRNTSSNDWVWWIYLESHEEPLNMIYCTPVNCLWSNSKLKSTLAGNESKICKPSLSECFIVTRMSHRTASGIQFVCCLSGWGWWRARPHTHEALPSKRLHCERAG